MSSKINAISTGVGGLATSADNSGILELQTNDTNAITVDGSQVVSFGNNFGTVAGLPSFQCRAWVNFNGTGTVAIRASGNVSSITDNAAGDYTINFTTAMVDANYVMSATSNWDTAARAGICGHNDTRTKTTSACPMLVMQATTYALFDVSEANVAIFR